MRGLPVGKRSVHLPHGVRDAVSFPDLTTTIGGGTSRHKVELNICGIIGLQKKWLTLVRAINSRGCLKLPQR